jgi:hypothetical protein
MDPHWVVPGSRHSCAFDKTTYITYIPAVLQTQAGLLKHSAVAEQAEKRVERDGLYWTAKYMKDVRATATATDPHWGLEGGLTPLAAVYAAQWRNKVLCLSWLSTAVSNKNTSELSCLFHPLTWLFAVSQIFNCSPLEACTLLCSNTN